MGSVDGGWSRLRAGWMVGGVSCGQCRWWVEQVKGRVDGGWSWLWGMVNGGWSRLWGEVNGGWSRLWEW